MTWEQLSFQFSCLSLRVLAVFTSTSKTKRERKENNMDAGILMMIFVIAVANIGGIYFYLQDKKENQ